MAKKANGANESFDFLGFTHKDSIGRTGYYKVLHLTSQKKLRAKKQIAKQWIKDNTRLPVEEIIKKLNVKLIGHYRYYGITDNFSRMISYRSYVMWELYKKLKRRSQKDKIRCNKFFKILEYNPIAMPKIYFSLW